MESEHTLDDLLYLMQRLRDPETGCPWDIAQSFETIVPSTLEEAYEVADTIERNDLIHLEEELGDLLFQVVFYAQLGSEEKLFSFNSIVSALTSKLVRRHPHVFKTGRLKDFSESTDANDSAVSNSDDIKLQWELIKTQERAAKGKGSQLADVPINFPAITRAQKLQKRAAQVGFDFGSVGQAMAKVHEELAEVEAEIASMQGQLAHRELGQELGDLMFSVINVCRLAKFDGESLLREANRKFEKRFSAMEKMIEHSGKSLDASSLQDMEAAWLKAKRFD